MLSLSLFAGCTMLFGEILSACAGALGGTLARRRGRTLKCLVYRNLRFVTQRGKIFKNLQAMPYLYAVHMSLELAQ